MNTATKVKPPSYPLANCSLLPHPEHCHSYPICCLSPAAAAYLDLLLLVQVSFIEYYSRVHVFKVRDGHTISYMVALDALPLQALRVLELIYCRGLYQR